MILGNRNNHNYYAAHTVAAKSQDSKIKNNDKQVQQQRQALLSMAMANIVEEEDLNNIVLPSIDSESSVFSMASSSTTDSDTVANETETSTSTGRRRIFSKYWQKNPEQPRSPLIQHYPSRSESGTGGNVIGVVDDSTPSPSSVTSPIQQFDSVPISKIHHHNNNAMLSVSPSRRSIFGAASPSLLGILSSQDENEDSSNNNTTDTHQNNNIDLDLNRFFSNHEHMKVLSSSMDTVSSAGSTHLLQRRPRSYSYSDALHSVRNNKRTHPLPSCLKRSNSSNININSNSNHTSQSISKGTTITSSSTNTSTTTITNITTTSTHEQQQQQPLTLSDSTRNHSVTFDSQIEIVAFEPTNSYEGASTCTDGSWTDLFER